MLPWDKTYIDAKEIINGTRDLDNEFKILKDFLYKEFDVELINADIYKEPVFKDLPSALRMILDFTDTNGKLPIRNEERKIKIGDVFINLLKTNQIGKYQYLNYGELAVSYLDIHELRFEETLLNASLDIRHDIRQFDTDIIEILRGGHTFFIIYSNSEILTRKKELGQEQNILNAIIERVKEKGYNGEYLKKIQVIVDEIENVNKAGGSQYYTR